GDFAASSRPILLVAPGRLSATTGWCICSDSFCAMARPAMSVGPPGGKGRIRRMAFAGYVCASAAEGAVNAASVSAAQASLGIACMGSPPWIDRIVAVLGYAMLPQRGSITLRAKAHA